MIRFPKPIKEGLNLTKKQGYPNEPITLKSKGVGNHEKNKEYVAKIFRSDYASFNYAPIIKLLQVLDNGKLLPTPGQWYVSTFMGRDRSSRGLEDSDVISIDAGQHWEVSGIRAMKKEIEQLENDGKLPKHEGISEGLNLAKNPTFNQRFENLVIKYKPGRRQTTTDGYEWEFPLEAKDELDDIGITWYEIEKVTNPEHPNYRKQYISFNMYHGRDSGISHMVREGLNLQKMDPIQVGDKVKLRDSFFLKYHTLEELKRYRDNPFTVIEIDPDGRLKLYSNRPLKAFQLFINPEYVTKIAKSQYIQECLDKLPILAEGLNLPKREIYYSLSDPENGGNMMFTGLNSKSLEELRLELLDYMAVDYITEKENIDDEDDEEIYNDWLILKQTSLGELVSMQNFHIIEHTKPYVEGDWRPESAEGSIEKEITVEGLNLVKGKQWLYSLIDKKMTSGQLMRTGLNSITIDILKQELFEYAVYELTDGVDSGNDIFGVYEEHEEEIERLREMPLEELCYEVGVSVVRHVEPLDAYARVNPKIGKDVQYVIQEGLNLSKVESNTPEIWLRNIMKKTTQAKSPTYVDSIYFLNDLNHVYFEYELSSKTLIYHPFIESTLIKKFGIPFGSDIHRIVKSTFEKNFTFDVKDNWRASSSVMDWEWGEITDWAPLNEGLNLTKAPVQIMSVTGFFEFSRDMSDHEPEYTYQRSTIYTCDKDFLDYAKVELDIATKELLENQNITLTFTKIDEYSLCDVDNAYIRGKFKIEIPKSLKTNIDRPTMVEMFEAIMKDIDKNYGIDFRYDWGKIKFTKPPVQEGLNLPKKKYLVSPEDENLMTLRGTFEEVVDIVALYSNNMVTNNEDFETWAQSGYDNTYMRINEGQYIPIRLIVDSADITDVENATIKGKFVFEVNETGVEGWGKEQLTEMFMDDFMSVVNEYGVDFSYDEDEIVFNPPLTMM